MEFVIEHLGLAARDPQALKEWYLSALGAKLVFDNGQSPPAFLISLGSGMLIEIYPSASALPQVCDNKLGGWRHLALKIPNLEAARQWLLDHGVAFEEPIKPAGGGGRVLFFKDPEGNLLHLVERSAEGFRR